MAGEQGYRISLTKEQWKWRMEDGLNCCAWSGVVLLMKSLLPVRKDLDLSQSCVALGKSSEKNGKEG